MSQDGPIEVRYLYLYLYLYLCVFTFIYLLLIIITNVIVFIFIYIFCFLIHYFMPGWRNRISRLTSNQEALGSSPRSGAWQLVRVVKEIDQKSNANFVHRFESCSCRFSTFGKGGSKPINYILNNINKRVTFLRWKFICVFCPYFVITFSKRYFQVFALTSL